MNSLQSGILPTTRLLEAFHNEASSVRAFKVCIENGTNCFNVTFKEQLIISETLQKQSSWSEDFKHIENMLDTNEPAFILYKIDSRLPPNPANDGSTWLQEEESNSSWLMMLFIPNTACVRSKMLYASTKNTLSKELGDSNFVDQVFGTAKSEFTLHGYRSHREHQNAENPLTNWEKDLREVKSSEANLVGLSARGGPNHPTLGMLSFPFQDTASVAVDAFANSTLSLVVLAIDIVAEIVSLDFSTNLQNIDELVSLEGFKLGKGLTEPRFILFRWTGTTQPSVVFAFTCPGTSRVKERTLYSSARGSVVSFIQTKLGEAMLIAKKLDHPKELTSETLIYEFQGSRKAKEAAITSVQRIQRPIKPSRSKTGL